MNVVISAPFPAADVTMLLPSPDFDDAKQPDVAVEIKRSMNGEAYSYVKRTSGYVLTLPFSLTRMKAKEVERFCKLYQHQRWRVKLHDDSNWVAQLHSAVNDFRTEEAARGLPGNEWVKITLTLYARRVL